MPKPRRKNRRPAAKCKKKPQKPARARSASRSYSYSRSRSYSDSEGSSDGHSDEDDPRDYKRGGYHPVTPYQLYNARYRVLSKLGAGAFSTVWLCADEKISNGLVAMKVCKSKKSVAEQAQDEVMLFEQMQQNGRSSPFVVKMTDHFWHTGPNGRHKCMTFEVMGENLLALVKHYDYNGIPLPMCKRLSRHTLKGLEYIHACGVVHTDVKLENVLICRHDMTALLQEASQAHLAFSEQKSKLESLSKSQKKRLKKKNKKAAEAAEAADAKASDEEKADDKAKEEPEEVPEVDVKVNGKGGYCQTNGTAPETSEMAQPVPPVRQRERFSTLKLEEAFAKLADFGNGIKVNHPVTNDIQTRQYRSPEVIIGAAWDETADVWSAACMFFELATGDFLFDPKKEKGDDWDRDEDHLALIAELLGDLPDKEFCLSGKYSKDFFNNSGKLKHIKNLKMWPLYGVLNDKYAFSEDDAKEMCDFLLPMLAWQPAKRQSATEALKHSWLKPGEEEIDDVVTSGEPPAFDSKAETAPAIEVQETEASSEAEKAPETPEQA